MLSTSILEICVFILNGLFVLINFEDLGNSWDEVFLASMLSTKYFLLWGIFIEEVHSDGDRGDLLEIFFFSRLNFLMSPTKFDICDYLIIIHCNISIKYISFLQSMRYSVIYFIKNQQLSATFFRLKPVFFWDWPVVRLNCFYWADFCPRKRLLLHLSFSLSIFLIFFVFWTPFYFSIFPFFVFLKHLFRGFCPWTFSLRISSNLITGNFSYPSKESIFYTCCGSYFSKYILLKSSGFLLLQKLIFSIKKSEFPGWTFDVWPPKCLPEENTFQQNLQTTTSLYSDFLNFWVLRRKSA